MKRPLFLNEKDTSNFADDYAEFHTKFIDAVIFCRHHLVGINRKL